MSAAPALSGPILPPAAGGAPRRLVALLHGVRARGEDMIARAGALRAALPDAAIFAPDAPFPCDDAPGTREWFSLADRAPAVLLAGAQAAAGRLDAALDERLRALGLGDGVLALVGFSQGAAMALHAGLRRKRPATGIVAFSGAFMGARGGEIASRPPVLLVHGEDDAVVPFAAMARSAAALRALGVPVETLARRGLGHDVDAAGLDAAARFLAAPFGAGLA